MFSLLLLALNTAPLVASAQAEPPRPCIPRVRAVRPEWNPALAREVCTAFDRIVLNSNEPYASCVVRQARRYTSPENVVEACERHLDIISDPLPPIPVPAPVPHPQPMPPLPHPPRYGCVDSVMAIRTEWRVQDAIYVCTARQRHALDSSPEYNECVTNYARRTSDGEWIINQCLSNPPAPRGQSCLDQLARARSQWDLNDLMYVCTARHRIPLDTRPEYSTCVAHYAWYTVDGEELINLCTTQRPVPGSSCLDQMLQIRKEWRMQDALYVCTARQRKALDLDPAYNRCLTGLAYRSGDGELLINTCSR